MSAIQNILDVIARYTGYTQTTAPTRATPTNVRTARKTEAAGFKPVAGFKPIPQRPPAAIYVEQPAEEPTAPVISPENRYNPVTGEGVRRDPERWREDGTYIFRAPVTEHDLRGVIRERKAPFHRMPERLGLYIPGEAFRFPYVRAAERLPVETIGGGGGGRGGAPYVFTPAALKTPSLQRIRDRSFDKRDPFPDRPMAPAPAEFQQRGGEPQMYERDRERYRKLLGY